MKIIYTYMANDGSFFSNEDECIRYEMNLILADTTLRVYKGNKRLKDLLSDDTHNYCTRVVVPDQDALYDLDVVKDYTGYYYGIDNVGTWKYNDENSSWERVGE